MKHDDAVRGIDVAQTALRAAALDDDAGMLAVLNGASHAETVVAAAYLVSVVREAMLLAHDGNRARAAQAILAGASNVEDGVAVMIDTILDDEIRRLSGEVS